MWVKPLLIFIFAFFLIFILNQYQQQNLPNRMADGHGTPVNIYFLGIQLHQL